MRRVRTDRLPSGLLIGIFFILLTIFIPRTGLAHRVTVFAWVEGTTVHTQSRFAGGRAVKNGRISVYDAKGELYLSGQTDSAGEFDFDLPASAGARIVLDAGMGHGNEWVITAQDMHSESPNSAKAGVSSPPDGKDVSVEQSQSHGDRLFSLKREEVKAIIDESIDNKLKPIMRSLAALQDDRPSFTDIVGGIGYIIGLVGVGAYVHSRKKR